MIGEKPVTFGLWYLIGRGVGAVSLHAINGAVGIALGSWEAAMRVRRFLHQ